MDGKGRVSNINVHRVANQQIICCVGSLMAWDEDYRIRSNLWNGQKKIVLATVPRLECVNGMG